MLTQEGEGEGARQKETAARSKTTRNSSKEQDNKKQQQGARQQDNGLILKTVSHLDNTIKLK